MSSTLAPLAHELFHTKRASAEATLGFAPALDDSDLYHWAERIIKQLGARGDPHPKLSLARALGITTDSAWLRGAIPTTRYSPRHRVVARLAREGVWEQIWSLNWDCIQENALASVGIERDNEGGICPWPTSFCTLITASDCPKFANQRVVRIVKPHGCVMALLNAEEAAQKSESARVESLCERFLITAGELEKLTPPIRSSGTQQFLFANMCAQLAIYPLIIVGWSVSELYLRNFFHNLQLIFADTARPTDQLTIIDRKFNDEGHSQLAEIYGTTQTQAYTAVNDTDFTTDTLFLWIQALYALDHLRQCATDEDREILIDLTSRVEQRHPSAAFVIDWVDNMLPTWVRLCWRCGFVSCHSHDHKPLLPEDINLERANEHIPWNLPLNGRPDLRSAAALLAALSRNGNGMQWDYINFPGGIVQKGHLVVPVPFGGQNQTPNDLRGLKPLLNSMTGSGAAEITEVSILPISMAGEETVAENLTRELKALLARELSAVRFMRGESIQQLQLEDL